MIILEIIGSIIIAYIIYMIVIALLPIKSIKPEPFKRGAKPPGFQRKIAGDFQEVAFEVEGDQVHAWLYLPQNAKEPAPCIIMAHGMGGVKKMGLDATAAYYQKEGFATLVFDYRRHGQSEGEPRGLIWINDQLADYRSAIEYAKSRPEINPEKIALWGSSLSGGHVLTLAAQNHDIACIIAQVPLLSGEAGGKEKIKKIGLGLGLKLAFVHGVRDMVRSWMGLSPHKIPVVGRSGTIALIPDDEAWKTFERVTPPDYPNEACARIFIRIDKYHPVHHLKKIKSPVLLQICEKDLATTPPEIVERAAKELGEKATVVKYPLDHFDIYSNEGFQNSIKDQVKFLKEKLK